jgi:hypothetical protein
MSGYESEGYKYSPAVCGHYHNAERVGGSLWRLRRKWKTEKPVKWGFGELPDLDSNQD